MHVGSVLVGAVIGGLAIGGVWAGVHFLRKSSDVDLKAGERYRFRPENLGSDPREFIRLVSTDPATGEVTFDVLKNIHASFEAVGPAQLGA